MVFKKLVLSWMRIDKVLKKVITLCENILFSFENRTENLKGSHWKRENCPTLVYTIQYWLTLKITICFLVALRLVMFNLLLKWCLEGKRGHFWRGCLLLKNGGLITWVEQKIEEHMNYWKGHLCMDLSNWNTNGWVDVKCFWTIPLWLVF
jgi:hypothetical protein